MTRLREKGLHSSFLEMRSSETQQQTGFLTAHLTRSRELTEIIPIRFPESTQLRISPNNCKLQHPHPTPPQRGRQRDL